MNRPDGKKSPGKQTASRGFQVTKDISVSGQKVKGGKTVYTPVQAHQKKKKATAAQAARKNRSPVGSGERILIGGILVTGIAVVASLFFYFHPVTLADVAQGTRQGIEKLHELALAGFEKVRSWKEDGTAHGAANETAEDPADPDDALSSSENARSITDLDRTSELGAVEDFALEPIAPLQEDSIYTCMLDTALGPMLYYNQGDIRWKEYLYGGYDPISRYGCGPSCVAMVIGSFSPTPVSPIEMADWSAENGYYALHGGSYHSLIPESLSAFGLQVDSVTDRSAENAAELLRTGHILVALMGKGSLTKNGHFIVIAQLCPNGNVYIADPASYENSTKEWDLQQLMDELKESYDHGGPLWAVSLPGSEGGGTG